MEEQIKEMTVFFSGSIHLIEHKDRKLQKDVESTLANCNNKIEEINKKLDTERSAQKILPPSFTGNIPASNEHKNKVKVSEALKTTCTT